MAQLSIAILGLGRVGASVGLALRRYMRDGGKNSFTINGYDPRGKDVEQQAKTMGAIDNFHRRAHQAARGQDIVIIALPHYDETEAIYREIAPDLREGVVILDMSPLKTPSQAWAGKHLSSDHHVVGMTPTFNVRYLYERVNTTEKAAEDLFDGGMMFISPAVSAASEAVDLALSFAGLLGARTHFVDPAEHDALIGAMETLPMLLGVASFYAMMTSRGWGDLQRYTNPPFGALTRDLHDLHPDALRDILLNNSENLVRSLDELLATMHGLREMLHEQDRDGLEVLLQNAAREYEAWINRRIKGDWEGAAKKSEEITAGGMVMDSLFGRSISRRVFGKGRDEE